MIPRTKSEESLDTLLTPCTTTTANEADSLSVYSGETLNAAAIPIFRNPISSYTRVRELPVVSGKLNPELLLYPSVKALKEGGSPLFSIQSNKFHFLKKSTPLLTTYRHQVGSKSEFCKIYFKILQNNLTCYVLMFNDGPNVVLFNNALKPHCDAVYKDTKLRFYGASGAASTFGNSSVKMVLLSDASSSLADNVDEEVLSQMHSIKEFELSSSHKDGNLYNAVVHQRRAEVSKILNDATSLVRIPFATFTDHGGEKIQGVKMEGSIRLFESTCSSGDEFTYDSLILTTMMLTLVEQEFSKMRGHNKPSYVTPGQPQQ